MTAGDMWSLMKTNKYSNGTAMPTCPYRYRTTGGEQVVKYRWNYIFPCYAFPCQTKTDCPTGNWKVLHDTICDIGYPLEEHADACRLSMVGKFIEPEWGCRDGLCQPFHRTPPKHGCLTMPYPKGGIWIPGTTWQEGFFRPYERSDTYSYRGIFSDPTPRTIYTCHYNGGPYFTGVVRNSKVGYNQTVTHKGVDYWYNQNVGPYYRALERATARRMESVEVESVPRSDPLNVINRPRVKREADECESNLQYLQTRIMMAVMGKRCLDCECEMVEEVLIPVEHEGVPHPIETFSTPNEYIIVMYSPREQTVYMDAITTSGFVTLGLHELDMGYVRVGMPMDQGPPTSVRVVQGGREHVMPVPFHSSLPGCDYSAGDTRGPTVAMLRIALGEKGLERAICDWSEGSLNLIPLEAIAVAVAVLFLVCMLAANCVHEKCRMRGMVRYSALSLIGAEPATSLSTDCRNGVPMHAIPVGILMATLCLIAGVRTNMVTVSLAALGILFSLSACSATQVVGFTSGSLEGCRGESVDCETSLYHRFEMLPFQTGSLDVVIGDSAAHIPINLDLKMTFSGTTVYKGTRGYATNAAETVKHGWECPLGSNDADDIAALCVKSQTLQTGSCAEPQAACLLGNGHTCCVATLEFEDHNTVVYATKEQEHLETRLEARHSHGTTEDGQAAMLYCLLDGQVYGNYHPRGLYKSHNGDALTLDTGAVVELQPCENCHTESRVRFPEKVDRCTTTCYVYEGNPICQEITFDHVLVSLEAEEPDGLWVVREGGFTTVSEVVWFGPAIFTMTCNGTFTVSVEGQPHTLNSTISKHLDYVVIPPGTDCEATIHRSGSGTTVPCNITRCDWWHDEPVVAISSETLTADVETDAGVITVTIIPGDLERGEMKDDLVAVPGDGQYSLHWADGVPKPGEAGCADGHTFWRELGLKTPYRYSSRCWSTRIPTYILCVSERPEVWSVNKWRSLDPVPNQFEHFTQVHAGTLETQRKLCPYARTYASYAKDRTLHSELFHLRTPVSHSGVVTVILKGDIKLKHRENHVAILHVSCRGAYRIRRITGCHMLLGLSSDGDGVTSVYIDGVQYGVPVVYGYKVRRVSTRTCNGTVVVAAGSHNCTMNVTMAASANIRDDYIGEDFGFSVVSGQGGIGDVFERIGDGIGGALHSVAEAILGPIEEAWKVVVFWVVVVFLLLVTIAVMYCICQMCISARALKVK